MDNTKLQAAGSTEDASHGSQVLVEASSIKQQAPSFKQQATSLPQSCGTAAGKQKGKNEKKDK